MHYASCKVEIAEFCEYTLQKMQEFDIDFYFKISLYDI